MIADDMIHGRWTEMPPRYRISMDTPALPHVIAASVVEEASAWLGEPLPKRWVSDLATRAETVYSRNTQFRRRVRGHGDTGRDWLWAFMRHWLAARLKRNRPELYARLPDRYNVGHPLG